MAGLITLLGTIAARIFSDKILGWIAIKVLLVALFTVVIPLVLNNFLYDIIEIILGFANTQASGASSFGGVLGFTGFGAWLIDCFRIPAALSVIISAFALRAALSMVPFVRL
jgi:hypothetical protein